MRDLNSYLAWMVENDASDLYLVAGRPPIMKVEGELIPSPDGILEPQHIDAMVGTICNEKQKADFGVAREMNLAYGVPKVGRFRVNLYKQQGSTAIVLRFVKMEIPSFGELHLPECLGDLAVLKRGLILITGPAGSGKSTTLAAMIDYRNSNMSGHIITIEDPIEFVHRHKKSIVSQREVGIDTDTFNAALRNVLRQAPDVILIGEMRDTETVAAAVNFAETGHLVLATLHSSTTEQAVERILNFFPREAHQQIFQQLSLELAAIVGMRLLQRADGNGLIPACEIMLTTPRIKELIQKGSISELKSAMSSSGEEGNVTFDQSLYDLCKQGYITEDEAIRWADSKNNLRLKFRTERAREEGRVPGQPGYDTGLRISRRR